MTVLYPANRKLPTPKQLSTAFKSGKVFRDSSGKTFTIHSFPVGEEVQLVANPDPVRVQLNKRSAIDVIPRRSVTLRIQKGQTNAA